MFRSFCYTLFYYHLQTLKLTRTGYFSANTMLSKVRKMKSLSDDDEVAYSNDSSAKVSSTQPAWMRALAANAQNWLGLLPEVRCVIIGLVFFRILVFRTHLNNLFRCYHLFVASICPPAYERQYQEPPLPVL